MGHIVLLALLIIIGCAVVRLIRIVPQQSVYIVEELGKYKSTWEAGLHFKIPIIQSVRAKVVLKETFKDFAPQPVITKDNVTMHIDSVVFFRVTDPYKYVYGIVNPIPALENLTATTLRSIIGEMNLDDTLASREEINGKMTARLDEDTDQWGIKVLRVEVKNIIPPEDIKIAMEKQMQAEREKRKTVLESEAYLESTLKRAEADKKAKVMAAEAQRDASIAVAEGKARAIQLTYEAEANGLEKLKNANVSGTVLKLKELDALKIVADGRATKIFMPTDLASSVTQMGLVSESLGIGDSTKINTDPKPKRQRDVDVTINDETSKQTIEAYESGERIEDEIVELDKEI